MEKRKERSARMAWFGRMTWSGKEKWRHTLLLETNTAVVAEHPDTGEEAHGAGSEFLLLGDDADFAFFAGLEEEERGSQPLIQ